MSASQAPALDAISLQLVAALELYEADTRAMIDAWPDLERYRTVSAQVEQIRMLSSALPELRLQWAELLITHAELIHHLWRVQYGPPRAVREQIASFRERHSDAVAALRGRCLREIARRERAGR
jgi:hypothetical protein